MVKIGVVGAGYWGKNIIRVLSQLGAIQAVCDSDPRAMQRIKSKYAGISCESSFKKFLENPYIKTVAIATPAATHYNLIKRSLLAAKDVFVEKPLALKIKKAKELSKIAKEKNRILMVGHLLQYHPAVRKLKDIILKGRLGKIQYICSNRLNIGKLRTEENILWSFAPHDVSVVLMLLEQRPKEVDAFGAAYLNKGSQDITLTTFNFKNNAKGHIFVSWLHPYKEQKLIVIGSKAMAVFDDLSKEKLFIYPHKIKWNGKIPVAKKADCFIVKVKRKEPLEEEMKHFIECVKKRKKPKTDAEEAIRVLEVLEKAQKSLADKK